VARGAVISQQHRISSKPAGTSKTLLIQSSNENLAAASNAMKRRYCIVLLGPLLLLILTPVSAQDWLPLTHGRTLFRQGYWTDQPDELDRFVATSGLGERRILGPWEVEVRHGIYHSNETNPDTSNDEPASVIVRRHGNVVFAGKGYRFDLRPASTAERLLLWHWNGVMGCTISQIHLTPKATVAVTMLSTKTEQPCQTQPQAEFGG